MVIGGADYQSGMIHVVDKQNKICPMADKSMSVVCCIDPRHQLPLRLVEAQVGQPVDGGSLAHDS